jgi:hypothetical protein
MTFHTFPTLQEARDYRHANGLGGWIFADDATGESILFPANLYPAAIFHHPMTRGRSGALIGSQ